MPLGQARLVHPIDKLWEDWTKGHWLEKEHNQTGSKTFHCPSDGSTQTVQGRTAQGRRGALWTRSNPSSALRQLWGLDRLLHVF